MSGKRLLLTFELIALVGSLIVVLEKSSVEAHSTVKAKRSTNSSWIIPELIIVRNLYDGCQDKNDFIQCLKEKAIQALSRGISQNSIEIYDGFVLEKQNQTEKESFVGSLSDARTLSGLSLIDQILLIKADKFARTHALKIDIGSGRGQSGGDRKRKKHKGGGHVKYVVAALLTAMGIAGPIGLKALAVIAGKALVISKVALTIAGIIALKKLFSHDNHEETSFQVHAADHNRRSTFLIRPITKSNGQPAVSSSVDPYRYYYEYH